VISDRGFYPKYRAFKIEGVNEIMPGVPIRVAGIPVEEVTSPFFLLKFDDPHARPAIAAYAYSCEEDYPILAADLRRKLRNTKVKERDGS
jgi:hypothetical protein